MSEAPTLPTVPFGDYQITRLISGANPVCGLSHLSPEMDADMKAYFSEQGAVSYFHDLERHGINTLQARGDFHRILHWRELFQREGGRLHWIGQVAPEMHDHFENIRVMAAAGAIGIYYHGTRTDNMWLAGEIDKVEDYLKYMRDLGIRVGLGTHMPVVIEYAEEKGWDLDFYMACFYNLSVKPRESGLVSGQGTVAAQEWFSEDDPPKMVETIQRTDKQVLAFKILGATRRCATQETVRDAFRYAFDSIKPQDAVVVGMFPKYEDQIALNVQYTLEACAN
ncbi:MAG TPA: hypothetical protein VGM19_06005 [Armatimonadota bacterium]|jgi:hypothetical protein